MAPRMTILTPTLHAAADTGCAARRWPVSARLAPALVALLMVAGCGDEPPRERRMQTVKLLPDTPPPPPPKPPEEKRPEPPKPDKPQAQLPQAKPEPVQQAMLKSDEAAGDGPGGGLVAGTVSQDYTDQKIGQELRIGGSGEDATARLAASSYANAATRALNEFLARERELKRGDFRAQVNLWLAPNGSVERTELIGSTGDNDLDAALREALQRFPGTTAPPQTLKQPLRLRVTNRMLG